MEPQEDKKASLAGEILHWGELGYNPELPLKDRAINKSKFLDLIQR
jgi:hypothetical protein